MREITKSMISFSWAMSMYGMRQLAEVMAPEGGWDRAAASLDAVTRAAGDQLGSVTGRLFRAGDDLQRGMVDAMFSMFDPQSGPTEAVRQGTEALRRSASALDDAARATGSSVSGAWRGATRS